MIKTRKIKNKSISNEKSNHGSVNDKNNNKKIIAMMRMRIKIGNRIKM